jgi:uncharacterized membrane protein
MGDIRMPRRLVASAALVLAPAGVAIAQTASFQGLGQVPGEEQASCRALTADGLAVFGVAQLWNAQHTSYVPTGFRWTAATGAQLFPPVPQQGMTGADIYGASADGSVLVGETSLPTAPAYEAGRWTGVGGTLQLLTTYGGASGLAYALSADGATVAVSESGAFRWTISGGLQQLAPFDTGGGYPYIPYAISADGQVIAGEGRDPAPAPLFYSTVAFVSTGTGRSVSLGGLPGAPDIYSQALGVSADGSTVVGRVEAPSEYTVPFYWRPGLGMITPILPPGTVSGRFVGASAHGDVLVGTAAPDAGPGIALIWDRASGSGDLKQRLLGLGLTSVASWSLGSAVAINPAGTVIIGNGTNPQGQPEAWIARIPPFCYANCDQSTTAPVLNVLDFTCFLQHFAAADPYANCDQSTTAPVLNVLDFTCFLQRFAAGCP